MTPDQWLKLADIVVGLLIPIAVVGVGYYLNKRLKDFEHSSQVKRQLTETRFQIYKDIGYQLNDIFSYFWFVGAWKTMTYVDIVGKKRALDRHMHTFRPIFSEALFVKYDAFMACCFEMFQGMGKDPKVRTHAAHRPEANEPDVEECFTQENNSMAIKQAYKELQDCLAADLDIHAKS